IRRELGVELPLNVLFQHPDIQTLAKLITILSDNLPASAIFNEEIHI
ncbi:hypothetical protein DIU36_10385, partial [Mucilaginibacter rubeus]